MNTDHAPSKPSQGALRVALLYAVFAGLWILLSDWAMGLLFRDPESLVWASTAKGWFFVAVTTLVLYVLVARLVGQLNASHQRERAEAEEKWRATQLPAQCFGNEAFGQQFVAGFGNLDREHSPIRLGRRGRLQSDWQARLFGVAGAGGDAQRGATDDRQRQNDRDEACQQHDDAGGLHVGS